MGRGLLRQLLRRLLREAIGADGHIRYARYVVQWNAMAEGLTGANDHANAMKPGWKTLIGWA
jgi:hypothetical protein